MKDAWEAYFESIERAVDGRAIPESSVNPESDESRAFVAAFEAAQMSTADFLFRDQRWSRGAADRLTEEFLKASLAWLNNAQETGLQGLRLRLRHCFEEWLRQ
jgi:hypothetical protein